jgi:hypothetical protein
MHSFPGRVEPFFPLNPRIFRLSGRNFEKFFIFPTFCIYIGKHLCNVFPRNMKLLAATSHTSLSRMLRADGMTEVAKGGAFRNFYLCVMALLALPRLSMAGSVQSRSIRIGGLFSPQMAGPWRDAC